MRRRLALAAAVLVLAAVSCNGGDQRADRVPSATVGTEPPTTTTTNPYAVPATIDAAYVNRVLAGLDAIGGDIVRLVVSSRFIPRDAADRLKAIYANDTILQLKIDNIQADIRSGLEGYRLPTPGNKRSEAVELMSASSACIFTRVRRDYSAVSVDTIPETSTQWVAIRPLDKLRDPFGYNAVGWAYIYDGFERGFRAPQSDPCAAR